MLYTLQRIVFNQVLQLGSSFSPHRALKSPRQNCMNEHLLVNQAY